MKKFTLLLSLLCLGYVLHAQHLLLTPQGHTAKVNQVTYVNNAEVLSCSDDNSVILWNIPEGKLVDRFYVSQHKDNGEVLSLALDSNRKHFFAAGNITSDNQSYIIKSKIKDGTSIEWPAHKGEITQLKMMANGTLVSGGGDSLINFWAPSGKTYLKIGEIKCGDKVVAFDVFDNTLAVTTGGNGFDIYQLSINKASITASFISAISKHFHPCRVVRFSPNGEFLVSGGEDYLVNIYTREGKFLQRAHKLTNAITDIAFSYDNQNILASTLLGGEVFMVSIPEGKIVSKHTELNNTAQCVAFTPASVNGNYESIVSGGDNHNLHVFSAINGKLLKKLSDDVKSIGHIKALDNSSIGVNFNQTEGDLQYAFNLEMGTLKKVLAETTTPKVHYHDLLTIRKSPYQVKINGNTYTNTPEEGRFLSYTSQDNLHVLGYDNGAKIITDSINTSLKGVSGAIRASSFSKDKKWLFLGGEHQHIYILSTDSLANPNYTPEFNLSISEEGEWVMWTKEGFFMGSDHSDELLGWQMDNDKNPILALNEFSSFTELLYRPDLLLGSINSRKSITDLLHQKHESIVNLNLLYRASPPIFNQPFAFSYANDKKRSLSSETSEMFVTDTTDIMLSVSVFYGGGGIEELDLYQNGKLVQIDKNFELSNFKEEVVKDYPVRLLPGMNKFKVITTNKKQIKSSADYQQIKCTSLNHPVSDLHMLILGINEYKNPTMNLNYGVPDAKAISSAIEKQSKGIYTNVHTYSLFNNEVTLENIKSKIEKIKASAKISDVFIMYYAGHGVVHEGLDDESDFYMVLYDCIGDNVVDKGLSSTAMKSMLSEITANKQLVLIDACHSEASFRKNPNMMRRGLAEQQAIYQLARSSGTVIIAACGANQTAKEFTDLGHGAFTYAFIEAIQGDADGGRRDRKITVAEIKAYVEDRVPELTQKYSGTAQYPSGYSVGQDFPISLVQEKK